jgi:hypothetical protein
MGRCNYSKNGLISSVLGKTTNRFKKIEVIEDIVNQNSHNKRTNSSLACILAKEFDFPKEYIIKKKIGPEITLNGPRIININEGLKYIELGTIENTIIDNSNVNVNIPGSYIVTYTLSDVYGYTNNIERVVNVIENENPIIILNGSNPDVKYLGYEYKDPGVVVTNNANIVTQVSEEKIVYVATDERGRTNAITRNLNTMVVPPPSKIIFRGDNPKLINVGDIYIDPGCVVDIVSNVKIDYGNFSNIIPGEYNIIFTATNTSGNITKSRKVKVIPNKFTVRNVDLENIFPSKIDRNEIQNAIHTFENIIQTRTSKDWYDLELIHKEVNSGWIKYIDIEVVSKKQLIIIWNTNNYDRLLSYPKPIGEKSQVYYKLLGKLLKTFNIYIVLPNFKIIPYETKGDFWPIYCNKVVTQIDEIITHDKPWFISIKLMIKRCKKMWEGESCVFNKSDILKLNIKEDIKSGNVYPIFKFGETSIIGPNVKYNYYDTDIDIKYDGFGNFEINVYNSKFHKSVKSFFTINNRNIEIGKNYHGYIKKFSQVRI